MATVNIHEAKTKLSRLLQEVVNGQDVVIAKAGKPIARIVPIQEPPPRTPGLATGQLTPAFFEPLPEDELKAWEQ